MAISFGLDRLMWVIFGRSWAYSRRAPREGCHHREARHLLGCTCTPALGGAHAGVLAPLAAARRLAGHLHPWPQRAGCQCTCTPALGGAHAGVLAPLAAARRLPVHLHPCPRPPAASALAPLPEARRLPVHLHPCPGARRLPVHLHPCPACVHARRPA